MATGANVPATPTESIGPYRLVARLGRGGMGSVYLARRSEYDGFERLVALKCMHPHLVDDARLVASFIDEARLTARITHPFVCRVIDYGKHENTLYIAMEPLAGESLRRITAMLPRNPELRENPRFPLLAARVIANLCEGLHAAHEVTDEQGKSLEVVHRDVTPHNLYLLYDGTVRIIDFGIARARRRAEPTNHGVIKGKIGYLAPEQLLSGQSDRRSDVWAMGIVLWELLTGRRLFHAASHTHTVAALLGAPIAAPSAILPTVPRELDMIVLRALSRDPALRQATAREMAVELESVLARHGDPIPAADAAAFLDALFPDGSRQLQDALAGVRRGNTGRRTSVQGRSWGAAQEARSRRRSVATLRLDPPPPRIARKRRAMLVGVALALGPIVALAASHELKEPAPARLVSGFRLPALDKAREPPRLQAKPPAEPVAPDGFIVVHTVTGRAHVTVSGRYVGQTPIKAQVAPGKHWVVARKVGGGGMQGMRVEVQAGKLVHAVVRLPE